MSKPQKRYTRLTLARPIEQIERTIEVTADVSIPDLTGRSQEANGAIVVNVVR